MGASAYEKCGDALPDATIKSIEKTGLAIKGPIQTPLVTGFESPLIRLRKHFELYANVRQTQLLLSNEAKVGKIDIIVVRENMEGLYSAEESYLPIDNDPHGMAQAVAFNSKQGCERILRYAFDLAISRGRRKVTVVHKANVLKKLSGIFLEAARSLSSSDQYAGKFVYQEMIVDACAMQMAMYPSDFDVVVTTNMFGDILSDLAAGVTGGLGMAPGMNIGEKCALFEPIHGSAPLLAGSGLANPVALLLSGALLLSHVGRDSDSIRLRTAIDQVLNLDRIRTTDIGGKATTRQFTKAVTERL